MMATMLRTSDRLKLVVDNRNVDVDRHCVGVMVLYRTHVVLLVVVGSSPLLIDNSDPELLYLSCVCKIVVRAVPAKLLSKLHMQNLLSELCLQNCCLSCACKTVVVELALADADLLTESSCCSRSCHQSSCSSQRCCCHSPSMLVSKVEIGAGFLDVPVELVVLTLLTTITGDGAIPHLVVEEVGNVKLYLADVYFLLAVVVSLVVAFHSRLDVVVVVVLGELVLLNLVVLVVDDLFLNVPLVVDVLLDIAAPFFSAEVVKDVVVEQFLSANFCWTARRWQRCSRCCSAYCFCLMLCTLSSLSSSKAILLMSGLVVELIVVHLLDANFVLNKFGTTLLWWCWFSYVLLDVEDTLGVERLVVHSLVVRSCCRCSPYFCCELAVEQLFFSSLLS